jgi:hypothetical protein
MSRKRLFSGIALAVVLAACGDSGGDPLGPGAGPSFDSGGPLVGGNRSDSTSTGSGSGSGTSTTTSEESGGPIVGGN